MPCVTRFLIPRSACACGAIAIGWQAVGEYFLASAFEKVLVQKSGYVGLTGAGAQSLFFRGFFDKYGIKPEIFSREVGGLTRVRVRARVIGLG